MSNARGAITIGALATAFIVTISSASRGEDQPPPDANEQERAGGIGASVEQFLLEMRERIREEEEGEEGQTRSSGWGAEAFRGALRRAGRASGEEAPRRVRASAAAATRTAPPDWVRLLDAALRLEQVAHDLDRAQLWDGGESVREAALELRRQARERTAGDLKGASPAQTRAPVAAPGSRSAN